MSRNSFGLNWIRTWIGFVELELELEINVGVDDCIEITVKEVFSVGVSPTGLRYKGSH